MGVDTFLVSLIYTSEMTVHTDFTDILEVSRKNNARDGITGALLFSNNNIIQCLEGGREAVNKTFTRIVKDKRHENPLLVDYRMVSMRLFSNWSMGYVPESFDIQPILLKYSPSQEFEPRLLSGESSLRMMTELAHKVDMV